MIRIAAIILENDNREILLYLRDNKPGIPFPHHWDLIGGHIDEGETPEEALIREIREELNIGIKDFRFFRRYDCPEFDAYPNVKYIYSAGFNIPVEEITLLEGERACYFSYEEVTSLKFANILKTIVTDYIGERLNGYKIS
jgi:8-oxo-dGTP diphosphatase